VDEDTTSETTTDTHAERDSDGPQDIGLRLDGVELMGKYRGSGLQEPPYLLRRRDGQVVQVSRLIYLIATCLDADRHPEPAERRADEIARQVGIRFGKDISAENVTYLIDQKLRPAGMIAGDDAAAAATGSNSRANPLLSLRMRLPVVPERIHRSLSTACEPLFRPAVVVAALVGFVLVDAWLLFGQWHNLAAGTRQLIYQPQLLLGITLLTIAAGAFHEIGHAAAARYGGATPGAMGAGIYLVWPVFYTDVTDAYRLDRRGRLRTDLGGVYFNVLVILAITGLYLVTGYKPLLVFLVVEQLETLRQFLPFVRLDGYYVVSDLAGVPNLFSYVQPVLVKLLRRGDDDARRSAQAKLDELNPRARGLVTAWVCLTVPVLLFNLVGFLLLAPRLAGAAWGSAAGQLQAMTTQGNVDIIGVVNGLIGLSLLVLPLAGMSYVIGRLMRRLSTRARSWWHARPLVTATAGLVVATLVALQVAVEWPNTFASALERAQVAQALNEARSEGVVDEAMGATLAPPAEPVEVSGSQPDGTEPTASDPPASETTETTGLTGSAKGQSASGDSGSAGSGSGGSGSAGSGSTSTTGTVSPSTTGDAPDASGPATTEPPSAPGTQPNTRGADGSTWGNTNTPTTGAGRPPSTTTSTTQPPAPGPEPGLLDRLLDLLF
jgi:putative peptide zinc metalloprotease protein